MRAVVFDLSVPKYLAAKAFGKRVRALYDGAPSCLSFRDDLPAPRLPDADWVRLRPIAAGVCGSDVGIVYFKSAPTLSPYGSYPFVPGHEIVAQIAEVGSNVARFKEGDRVAVDPWLRCDLRGLTDCPRCAIGEYSTCETMATGPKKGMILGACSDLPGGWSENMVAHESQLFAMPDSVNDDRAVLMEPFSIAVHAVIRNLPATHERILVLGGGPIAFATVFALKEIAPDCDVTLFTWERWQTSIAEELGADRAWAPEKEDLVDRTARLTGATPLKPILGPRFLVGGFDRVFDCVGTAKSLEDAMALARSGATIVMEGAAGVLPKADMSHLWTKELRLIGTLGYAYEDFRGQRRRTFDITRELLEGSERPVEKLVTHRYPLERYRDALRANLDRNESRAVKTVLTV